MSPLDLEPPIRVTHGYGVYDTFTMEVPARLDAELSRAGRRPGDTAALFVRLSPMEAAELRDELDRRLAELPNVRRMKAEIQEHADQPAPATDAAARDAYHARMQALRAEQIPTRPHGGAR